MGFLTCTSFLTALASIRLEEPISALLAMAAFYVALGQLLNE